MSPFTVSRTVLLSAAVLLMNGCQLMLQKAAANPNALWVITHDMCVSDFQHNGRPSPCAEVNLDEGYVVVKDRRGHSQYLLIPTDRISGIEDPAILKPQATNYFYDAWRNRSRVGAALGKPLGDEQVSLAINPVNARSQNQLHIHIDCIAPDVRESLNRHAATISTAWSRWEWHGNDYQVRRLSAKQLEKTNPFKLVAQDIPGAAADMGHETIFMTGAPGDDLFLVVRRLAIAGLDGSGAEALQDHRCSVAQQDGATP